MLGTITFSEVEEYTIPTFLEYIGGGTEISLVFGIDYTASNGDPSQPTSLHFRDPHNPSHWNEYMSAIRIVGDICSSYDSSKLFPAFGFGGHLVSTNAVSHNFAVNGFGSFES